MILPTACDRLGTRLPRMAGSSWVNACIRIVYKPIFPEFIFQMLESFRSVQTDPALRPAPGFLTPHYWRRALAHAGFHVQQVEPDVERISELCPNFLSSAVCGQKKDPVSKAVRPIRAGRGTSDRTRSLLRFDGLPDLANTYATAKTGSKGVFLLTNGLSSNTAGVQAVGLDERSEPVVPIPLAQRHR